jgi:FAD dependent oxidoreductase
MPPVVSNSVNRSYDLIVFGDEVPGVLALVSAAREYRRQTGRTPRCLLMFKGNAQLGIGGHLVRGGLSYVDRSVVRDDIRKANGLKTFGDPSAIYEEFLQRAEVKVVGLDPIKADRALRDMLKEVFATTLSNTEIGSVFKVGNTITAIQTAKGEVYQAKQFIDCTVNAELAQFAGVPKRKGFETLGLPNSELTVGLTFETVGLTRDQLKAIDLHYLEILSNPQNADGQAMLEVAAGGDTVAAEQLRQGLFDSKGELKSLWLGGEDYIDGRSKALPIAYHAFRGTALTGKFASGAILDTPNIAVLGEDRMSWNAFLISVDADQAEALARGKAQPTAAMLAEIAHVQDFFLSLGATAVNVASELYIRHAGNIAVANDLLTGAEMLAGGVDAAEAIGTFGYHFDVRGGIKGLGERAAALGVDARIPDAPPLFNIGIQHALVGSIPNLAVVSPASGFDGYACSAGRIVEFNVAVGQGVGIAAAIALVEGRSLNAIENIEVHNRLANRGLLSKIYGTGTPSVLAQFKTFENTMAA